MASFDKQRWEDRIKKRFARSKGARPTPSSYAAEMKAINSLEGLVEWCRGKGYAVDFTNLPKDDAPAVLDNDTMTIRVSCRLLPERQLFTLLHECGHTLIGQRRKNERYGMGYEAGDKDPQIARTLHHRFDVLDEEIEAWHRGMKLSRRLRLGVDKERWHSVRLECLKVYAEWVLNPGEWT